MTKRDMLKALEGLDDDADIICEVELDVKNVYSTDSYYKHGVVVLKGDM